MSRNFELDLELYIRNKLGSIHAFDRETRIAKIQCLNKHVWEANVDKILSGNWCPHCKYTNREIAKFQNFEKVKNIAQERGGKCLSVSYVSNKSLMEWTCAEGHVWRATASHVKRSWCRECHFNSRRLKISECIQLAQSKQGVFLSKECLGSTVKHLWQCNKGHVFETRPNDVRSGYWCPKCAILKRSAPKINL